jgi:hypothetical protein
MDELGRCRNATTENLQLLNCNQLLTIIGVPMDAKIERELLLAEISTLMATLIKTGVHFPASTVLDTLSDIELVALRERFDHLVRTIPTGR